MVQAMHPGQLPELCRCGREGEAFEPTDRIAPAPVADAVGP